MDLERRSGMLRQAARALLSWVNSTGAAAERRERMTLSRILAGSSTVTPQIPRHHGGVDGRAQIVGEAQIRIAGKMLLVVPRHSSHLLRKTRAPVRQQQPLRSPFGGC